jgi:hypothetical protein
MTTHLFVEPRPEYLICLKEYDFINQFWNQVNVSAGGPSARWGASGGIDIRTAAVQDPVVPGPNNTFYLAGGFDGTTLSPLSDIWKLELSGTLSSNMPNTAGGSWVNISFGNLPSRFGQAGAMLHQQLIVTGGCDTATPSGNSCAQQDSYIIDTGMQTQISPSSCPAPRFGATLVPNFNAFSSSFSSQVFLLLGTFNTSLWQDDGGLVKGEVVCLILLLVFYLFLTHWVYPRLSLMSIRALGAGSYHPGIQVTTAIPHFRLPVEGLPPLLSHQHLLATLALQHPIPSFSVVKMPLVIIYQRSGC